LHPSERGRIFTLSESLIGGKQGPAKVLGVTLSVRNKDP